MQGERKHNIYRQGWAVIEYHYRRNLQLTKPTGNRLQPIVIDNKGLFYGGNRLPGPKNMDFSLKLTIFHPQNIHI